MAKAKTAYELLERVCEAIRAHPLNYYQALWVADRDSYDLPPVLDVPENTCGTAYCRAGWIVAVHDGRGAVTPKSDAHIYKRALDLIGFLPGDAPVRRLFSATACGDATPGTKAYVRRGVAGLRAFMKEHKAHLQARKLRGI